jgi:hypothetical protein
VPLAALSSPRYGSNGTVSQPYIYTSPRLRLTSSTAAHGAGVSFGDDRLMPVTVMPAALAGRLREADLTYSEAGATAGVLPPGYHHLRHSVVIGSGPRCSLLPQMPWLAGALAGGTVRLGLIGNRRTRQGAGARPGRGSDPDRRALPGRLRDRPTGPARRSSTRRTRPAPGHPPSRRRNPLVAWPAPARRVQLNQGRRGRRPELTMPAPPLGWTGTWGCKAGVPQASTGSDARP